jgi:ATP-dependent helicase YprA (DUF1998 family)
MAIIDFIESLKKDRRLNLQIVEHKYIPPIMPRYMKLDLSDSPRDVLKIRGIERFYSHQVEAIDLVRQGENVVVMTPTASGKSLIYNIPVIESIIENPEHRALYIFPLKGLEQDQVKNLNELYDAIKGIDSPSPSSPPVEGGENIGDPVERGAAHKPSPLAGEAPKLVDKISPYRAGFLPRERREIEQRLFSGELLGVISTSALELGVDIGGLDCCILCGYPGSIASTWQRAGRVGRHGQESMIAMIAIPDALDQYFMRYPEAFFEKSHEAAVIDPENRNILKKHIPCASSEVYLREDDSVYDVKKLMPFIDELVQEGILNPGRKGDIWFSRKKCPTRKLV